MRTFYILFLLFLSHIGILPAQTWVTGSLILPCIDRMPGDPQLVGSLYQESGIPFRYMDGSNVVAIPYEGILPQMLSPASSGNLESRLLDYIDQQLRGLWNYKIECTGISGVNSSSPLLSDGLLYFRQRLNDGVQFQVNISASNGFAGFRSLPPSWHTAPSGTYSSSLSLDYAYSGPELVFRLTGFLGLSAQTPRVPSRYTYSLRRFISGQSLSSWPVLQQFNLPGQPSVTSHPIASFPSDSLPSGDYVLVDNLKGTAISNIVTVSSPVPAPSTASRHVPCIGRFPGDLYRSGSGPYQESNSSLRYIDGTPSVIAAIPYEGILPQMLEQTPSGDLESLVLETINQQLRSLWDYKVECIGISGIDSSHPLSSQGLISFRQRIDNGVPFEMTLNAGSGHAVIKSLPPYWLIEDPATYFSHFSLDYTSAGTDVVFELTGVVGASDPLLITRIPPYNYTLRRFIAGQSLSSGPVAGRFSLFSPYEPFIVSRPVLTVASASLSPGEYVVFDERTQSAISNVISFPSGSFSPTIANTNYTRTKRYLDAAGTQYTESAVHYDGLGRAVQTVDVRAGGNGEDVIGMIEYDNMGRSDTKAYLSYPRPSSGFAMADNAASTQTGWYLVHFPDNSDGSYAYTQREYTGTTVTAYAPGADAQNYPVRTETYLNDGSESLLKYTPAGDGTILQHTGLYPAGTLTVQKTSQLNLPAGEQSESYTYVNSLGQVVAEETRSGVDRRITAYIYDDMGRQRYVIPPIQYDLLPQQQGGTIPLAELRKYCYYTEYDDHGRAVKQYVPGADPSSVVYDRRGRVALTQDGRQSATNQWTFTKYDNLDRPVLTGTLTGGDCNTHHTALQTQTAFGETRGTALHGYTNQTYPQAVAETDILTVLYYDDYTWIDDPQYSFSPADALDSGVDTENVADLPTGTKTKVLGISGDEWLTSVTYYNSKYRSIQSISGLYPAGIEIVSNLHNFTGDVTETKVSQTVEGQTYGYTKWFDYDETGRLQNIRQQMNGGDMVTLVTYTYDGLGNVSEKKIHNGLETTSHTYDIAGRQVRTSSPSFSYDLWFDKSPSGQSARHDGQLSQVTWGNNAAGDQKGYTFSYDPFKQLSSARFLQPSGTLWNATSQYAEEGPTGSGSPIGYDRNGNILSLTRTDEFGTARLRLAYHYDHPVNGNALTSITLNGTPSNTFEYDRNGNMTFDGESGVRIAYNLLNLPEKVSANNNEVTYIYSADGAKLATIAPSGSCTYYRSVFTYAREPNQPEALLYALHPEGLVTKTNTSWEYKYFKRDHVGSTRVLLAARGNQLVTEQQTDYYPFGLSHGGLNDLHRNRYLYGGKEYQDVALGGTVLGLYDFHARYYNPLLGRWFNPDPAHQTTNPYLYCGNSPMMYVDPDGEWIHLALGAFIGGVTNWAMNGAQLNAKGLGHFGIGAAAGALGAGVGGGVSSAIAGGSFGAGFMGSSAAMTATSSFLSGAAIGAGAGLSSGFASGFGNALLDEKSFSQALWSGTKTGLIAGGSGALFGGITGGIDAAVDGRRFWDGATVQRTTLAQQDIPRVRQIGRNDCGPASIEAVDRSFGGDITQKKVRSWEKFEGTDALRDGDTWTAYAEKSKHTWDAYRPASGDKLSHVLSKMQAGSRVAINLNTGGEVGHSVIMQNITQKTITKINGTVLQKIFYNVMDPGYGSFHRIGADAIINAHNVFYISY